jgi:hypothetical protein
MSEKVTETPNKLIDLISESYTTMINTLLWGTQRALEFNKVVISQLEVTQAESRKYFENLNKLNRQGMELLQETYQEGVKNYSTNVRNWRSTTQSTVAELNGKLEQMQQQLDSTVTVNAAPAKPAKN